MPSQSLGAVVTEDSEQEILPPEDEAAAEQAPLTVSQRSYTRGTIDGKPVLVCYDEATDETLVVGPQSKFYANAMAALDIIEAATTKIPDSELKPKRTLIHMPQPRGLIRAH